jgi:hypothetical protein
MLTFDTWLCSECDSASFPTGQGEGYVAVYALRQRLEDAVPAGAKRLMAMVFGRTQPNLSVTLDGEPVPVRDIDELQAGEHGWVTLYNIHGPDCPRCGDTGFIVRRGRVEVSLALEVPA